MRFHDLRHTTATLMLRAGVPVHHAQRVMRHKDVRLTTETYRHLVADDLRGAVEAIAPVQRLLGGPRSTRLLPANEPCDPLVPNGPRWTHMPCQGVRQGAIQLILLEATSRPDRMAGLRSHTNRRRLARRWRGLEGASKPGSAPRKWQPG
jgi:hypothetical protein